VWQLTHPVIAFWHSRTKVSQSFFCKVYWYLGRWFHRSELHCWTSWWKRFRWLPKSTLKHSRIRSQYPWYCRPSQSNATDTASVVVVLQWQRHQILYEQIHQRVPLYIGSTEEVEKVAPLICWCHEICFVYEAYALLKFSSLNWLHIWHRHNWWKTLKMCHSERIVQ